MYHRGEFLSDEELELACAKVHVPNHLLKMMANIVNQANIDPILASRMDDNIVRSLAPITPYR